MRGSIIPVVAAVAAALGMVLAWSAWRDGRSDASGCYAGPIGEAVAIGGGRFLMGSESHYPEEGPVVEAEVGGFDIDRHEVTNGQFRRFVEETGYVTSAERAVELGFDANGAAVFADGSWSFVAGANWRHPDGPGSTIEGRDREPVVQVSYEDARAYAEWAGRALPTEAEWEYAARGGLEGADYPWGDALVPDGEHRANTWQGLFPAVDAAEDGYAERAPVGCFAANAYRVYDLIGNVWEWTADPYRGRHRTGGGGEVPGDGVGNAGAAEGDAAGDTGHDPRQPGVPVGVIKGGSYLCAENFCRRYRPAARHPQDVQLGTNHIGFRTVGRAPGAG